MGCCRWIHTLLEEAKNERMHLLTFLELKQPSGLQGSGVLEQTLCLTVVSSHYGVLQVDPHAA